MRGFRFASLCLSLTASVWATGPMGRTDAATMDPYLPIRNSALQFELGVGYASVPGYFGSAEGTPDVSGSSAIKSTNAGTLTQLNLHVRHGFVSNTEAILDIPYVLGAGDARRVNPANSNSGTNSQMANLGAGDTSAAGFGDWTMGVKSAYEIQGSGANGGVGAYFALVLPVGEALGSGAYCNGDGQLDFGAFLDLTIQKKYLLMTNFVYGFDLPATNRQLDKQNSWSAYLRAGYLLAEEQYRPYVAFTYKGYDKYLIDDKPEGSGGSQMVPTLGIDMSLGGDFSAELAVDYTLMGSGDGKIAINNGFKVKAALKYFWFRY